MGAKTGPMMIIPPVIMLQASQFYNFVLVFLFSLLYFIFILT